jgi:pimeloyl-ACP methyl ester carboxylesterase
MSDTNGKSPAQVAPAGPRPPDERPVRKDEIVIEERGLYIESWLPERRSRRRPLYLLHGELAGSWAWERFLRYFAQRGWEGHALNLSAHFWSETADHAELDFGWYLADAEAGLGRLAPGAVVVGHGMGGLLALKLAERRQVAGLVLLSPALPGPLRPPARPHELQLPAVFRHGLLGWHLPVEQLVEQHSDLTAADAAKVQHMMGAESGAARREMLAGIPLERDALAGVPTLVIGAGLDRLYPAEDSQRLARWLGAEYQPFGAHSHYGLIVGETSFEQVAESMRSFLEAHRL